MSLVRVNTQLQYFTDQPEDVSSNTLYFLTATSPPSFGELSEITTRLSAFYGQFDEYLAACIKRTNGRRTRIYNMADPEPRTPIQDTTVNIVAAATVDGNLPLEVALCLSFQADPVSGIPQSRRRGRIYCGPFTPGALDDGSASSMPQPVTDLRTKLSQGATELWNGGANGVTWVVYSPTNNTNVTVSQAWIDNAFDTIRSRGNRASLRTVNNL